MGRVPLAASAAPAEVLADLLGPDINGIAVWAGKAAKTDRRIFVHLSTRDGRFWLAKISDNEPNGLRSEYQAVRYVQTMLAGSPYHDACRQQVDYREGVLVQEWRVGVSLQKSLKSSRNKFWRRAGIARDCAVVSDWLAGFHALGATPDGVPRTVSTLGATHGDFKPANILRRGDTALAVVDWELFDPRGIQIHDLFHFLLYSGMTVTAPDRMRGLRLTFFERSWVSQIARTCLWRYLRGSRCTSAALVEAFEHYIDATLQRRAALGLSNKDYFLIEAKKRTLALRHAPYAFEPMVDSGDHR
jgi:hypothetical protein